MKNLKITDFQHERIKSLSEKLELNVSEITDALLDYSLNKVEAGEASLSAPVPPRIEEPQPEEAAA